PVRETLLTLLTLRAPIAPFITEELWTRLGKQGSIHDQSWPLADESLLVEADVKMPVQVNGKVRGTIVIPTGSDQAVAEAAARVDAGIVRHLEDVTVVKVIFREGRMLNFVVR
ncbi:MAG: leucyl-tRNA synthetase, partial [Glaciecola sp.]